MFVGFVWKCHCLKFKQSLRLCNYSSSQFSFRLVSQVVGMLRIPCCVRHYISNGYKVQCPGI